MFMGIPPNPVAPPNPTGWPNKKPCPEFPPANGGLGACTAVGGVELSVVVELVVTVGGPAPPAVVVGAPAPPVPAVVGVPAPPTVVAAVTAAEAAVTVAAKIGPMVVVTTFVAVFKVGTELVLGIIEATCEAAPGAVAPPGCWVA